MNRIKTWGEILAELKEELGIQENGDPNLILQTLANEALYQVVQDNKNAREFFFQLYLPVTAATHLDITTIAIGAIEQVYYQEHADAGIATMRWDLTEQSGIPSPPARRGRPNAYILRQLVGTLSLPAYKMEFYPASSAVITDFIEVIGTGVPYIVDETTVMSYPNFYASIKLLIIERYRLSRNDESEKIQLLQPIIARSSQASMQGRDAGNKLAEPPPKTR